MWKNCYDEPTGMKSRNIIHADEPMLYEIKPYLTNLKKRVKWRLLCFNCQQVIILMIYFQGAYVCELRNIVISHLRLFQRTLWSDKKELEKLYSTTWNKISYQTNTNKSNDERNYNGTSLSSSSSSLYVSFNWHLSLVDWYWVFWSSTTPVISTNNFSSLVYEAD